MKWLKLGYGGVVGGSMLALVLAVGAVFLFQDNLTRFFLKPSTPFQIAAPPPTPDYRSPGAWHLWPGEDDARSIDVFYVHSTTFYSSEGWNADLNDQDAGNALRLAAAPNEAGPFMRVGRVFGPRYRQATIAAQFTHKYDGMAARALAYSDVSRAFAFFLSTREKDAPLLLVGYGQGGLHVMGLLREYFSGTDNELRRLLAAAYIIGEPAPKRFFETLDPPLPVCETQRSIRCVVAYTDYERRFRDEIARTRERSLMWDKALVQDSLDREPLVCVNPLNWRPDAGEVGRDRHLGAASATGLAPETVPPAVSGVVDAACVDGVLIVDTPRQVYLRRGVWFGAKWRARAYNLFYHDLSQNAALRAAALSVRLREESRRLRPIEESIDVKESPINKVPPV